MIGGAGYAAYRAGKNAQAGEDQEAEQDARIDDLEQQGQGQEPAEEAAPTSQDAAAQRIEALTQLKSLLDSGALTQEEFDQQKQQLLSGG